jgi:hypothetical protein
MATAKNEIPMILVVNAETGETNERPMTSDEIAQLKIESDELKAKKAEADAKAAARASALAKLADLGLSAEEIAAL